MSKEWVNKITPAELEIKLSCPPPFDFFVIMMKWSKEKNREPSKEELEVLWLNYLVGKRNNKLEQKKQKTFKAKKRLYA